MHEQLLSSEAKREAAAMEAEKVRVEAEAQEGAPEGHMAPHLVARVPPAGQNRLSASARGFG
mgnify:CR=1 FL=1